jgi:hypothetical protein
VWAADVQAVIPTFPVVLNGQRMENTHNQYPLLVYRDITYFPMVYDYARFLKLKSNWHENTRVRALFVGIAEDTATELNLYKTTNPNKSAYTATIPTYQIALNTVDANQFLDNTKEEYPLLNFQGVTYFPLTWRFAVEEFGWEYTFDAENGLRINTRNPFRPIIDDSVLDNTSANGIANARNERANARA